LVLFLHRLPIALEAIRQGYEVHIATSLTDNPMILRADEEVLAWDDLKLIVDGLKEATNSGDHSY